MKKALLLAVTILLTACATPKTVMTNDKGETVTCGGGRGGSMIFGVLGYNMEKKSDKECVTKSTSNGFKVVSAEYEQDAPAPTNPSATPVAIKK